MAYDNKDPRFFSLYRCVVTVVLFVVVTIICVIVLEPKRYLNKTTSVNELNNEHFVNYSKYPVNESQYSQFDEYYSSYSN